MAFGDVLWRQLHRFALVAGRVVPPEADLLGVRAVAVDALVWFFSIVCPEVVGEVRCFLERLVAALIQASEHQDALSSHWVQLARRLVPLLRDAGESLIRINVVPGLRVIPFVCVLFFIIVCGL